MKKILTTLAAIAVVSIGAQAQGLVNFANSASAGSKISTNSVGGGAATALTGTTAGTFYYALFYSAAATTVNGSASSVIPSVASAGTYVWSDANWTFSGSYATNTATAGRVQGNTSANGPGATVAGLAGGSFAQFVVVGWSASLGSTISALQAAIAGGQFNPGQYIGQSAVSGSVQVGDGVSVPNPAIIAASGSVTGFTLGVLPVPEPGTMALAALGGASLLLFRRKK